METHGLLQQRGISSQWVSQHFLKKLHDFHCQLSELQSQIQLEWPEYLSTQAMEVEDSAETSIEEILSAFDQLEELLKKLKASTLAKFLSQVSPQQSALISDPRKLMYHVKREIGEIQGILDSPQNCGEPDLQVNETQQQKRVRDLEEKSRTALASHLTPAIAVETPRADRLAVDVLCEVLNGATVENSLLPNTQNPPSAGPLPPSLPRIFSSFT